jgi:hypothetical protein
VLVALLLVSSSSVVVEVPWHDTHAKNGDSVGMAQSMLWEGGENLAMTVPTKILRFFRSTNKSFIVSLAFRSQLHSHKQVRLSNFNRFSGWPKQESHSSLPKEFKYANILIHTYVQCLRLSCKKAHF